MLHQANQKGAPDVISSLTVHDNSLPGSVFYKKNSHEFILSDSTKFLRKSPSVRFQHLVPYRNLTITWQFSSIDVLMVLKYLYFVL